MNMVGSGNGSMLDWQEETVVTRRECAKGWEFVELDQREEAEAPRGLLCPSVCHRQHHRYISLSGNSWEL